MTKYNQKYKKKFMPVYHASSNNMIYRLAVSMLSCVGKSYISSLFINRMFGHFPEASVMRNCCADPLYNKLSYDTRDIARSCPFNKIFPEIRLKGDKQNVHGWSIEGARQVSYFGAGVGGTVIGFGASMLAMTDDLYKSLEDALSDNNNEKTWSWKQGTHDSRIEGNCCMIDIGTRWSASDVLGRLEESREGKYYGVITRQFDLTDKLAPLYSVMYYDNKKQIIQIKNTNHLGGIEEEYLAYNFTGQPIKKLHIHSATGKSNIKEE